MTDHIDERIASTASGLYALRTLRSKGLSESLLKSLFTSVILSKLTYASPSWWGYTNASDKSRLEAFLKKARKAKFSDHLSFDEICQNADERLLKSVIFNKHHVPYYHPLLPPSKTHTYNTRAKDPFKNFNLPAKVISIIEKNFFPRTLYKHAK